MDASIGENPAEVPYGIQMVQALDVADDEVGSSGITVCIRIISSPAGFRDTNGWVEYQDFFHECVEIWHLIHQFLELEMNDHLEKVHVSYICIYFVLYIWCCVRAGHVLYYMV